MIECVACVQVLVTAKDLMSEDLPADVTNGALLVLVSSSTKIARCRQSDLICVTALDLKKKHTHKNNIFLFTPVYFS